MQTAVKDESVHTATCLRTLQVKANGLSMAEAHEAVIGQRADSAYAKRIAPIVNPAGGKSVTITAVAVGRYGKARSTYRLHSALQRVLAIHKRGYALPEGIEGCLRTAGQLEFGQNAANVGAHRSFADTEVLRDIPVASALGHQP